MPKAVSLRPARMTDSKRLFDWRNDPLTREQSRDTNPVEWAGHVAWLEKTLSGQVPGRTLIVAEYMGIPVGTVRGDLAENGEFYEVSYTTAPEERNKGFGGAMVRLFKDEYLLSKKIKLEIKKGNIPSEKIAQAIGFRPSSEFASASTGDLVIWE